MKLSALLMLMFITVVYPAAMRSQNKEFLNFLNEAFNRTSSEPSVIIVSDPSNAVGVPDPVAVCSSSTAKDNPTGTDSMEYPDTADEKSQENSNSDDLSEDYDHQTSKKKNNLPETLRFDNDSAESKSAERLDIDKYVKTEMETPLSKTQGPSTENRSSQEWDEPRDSVTDQERKKRMDTETGRKEHTEIQNSEIVTTKLDSIVPDQPQAKERNRKGKTEMMRENSDSVPLNDSQNISDQGQECVEVSSWMMGYPDMENTGVGGVDPQSEEEITNSELHSRKLCAGRKKLRAPRPQREQLADTDSAEWVNSELLDRDNSSERIPVQTL